MGETGTQGPDEGAGDRRGRWSPGLAVAVPLGALVLVGFTLVYLRAILVPLFFAIVLAVVATPLVDWLERRRVPLFLAIFCAELTALLPVLGVILVFVATAGPLSDALPKYKDALTEQGVDAFNWAISRLAPSEQEGEIRRQLTEGFLPEALSQGAEVLRQGLQTIGTLFSLFGYFFLTFLLGGFLLHEGRSFKEKFADAFGPGHPLLGALGPIGHDVRAYIVAKTIISGLTAMCVWTFLEICEVDFALFWGLVAFPLNFIPTVGAVVASLPPILVAVVDPELSAWAAGGVAVGLMAINGVIGSVLDPRWVGQTVKLSPLVVLLSMLLWGVLWGPVGMIIAVPIMVSVKLVCARVPGLEPVARLMTG